MKWLNCFYFIFILFVSCFRFYGQICDFHVVFPKSHIMVSTLCIFFTSFIYSKNLQSKKKMTQNKYHCCNSYFIFHLIVHSSINSLNSDDIIISIDINHSFFLSVSAQAYRITVLLFWHRQTWIRHWYFKVCWALLERNNKEISNKGVFIENENICGSFNRFK